jgi:hypothetical protein
VVSHFPREAVMGSARNVDDGVSLIVTDVQITPSELAFTYRVTNGSGHRIYLVNRLFHRRGAAGFQVDPDVVYSSVEPGRLLTLRKQLAEVPEEIDVEAPEVPYVTPVDPGETFAETVHLAFPVRPHDPYQPQPEGEPHLVSHFRFILGYLVASEPVAVAEVKSQAGEMLSRIDFADLRRGQRLKEVAPIEGQILTTAVGAPKPT